MSMALLPGQFFPPKISHDPKSISLSGYVNIFIHIYKSSEESDSLQNEMKIAEI